MKVKTWWGKPKSWKINWLSNNADLRSSSKCVSMPSAPGTEQMSRAFRKVLHLLTRQQWPPSSFCVGAKRKGIIIITPLQKHLKWTGPPRSLTNSCFEKTVQINAASTGLGGGGEVWVNKHQSLWVSALAPSARDVSQLQTTDWGRGMKPGEKWLMGQNC